MPLPFFDALSQRARAIDSSIGVGLDPHPADLARDDAAHALAHSARVVEATRDVALLYKPNVAFFERHGAEGIDALRTLVREVIGDSAPVLLDAKRGDIASTAAAYATAAFDHLGAGAITLSPYLGEDALAPFLGDPARAAFVLCKTSNPGADALQALRAADGRPMYLHVAALALAAAPSDNVGLVVGATQLDAIAAVRRAHPAAWLLTPGVGAQGGDLAQTVAAGLRDDGLGLVIPASRAIARAVDPGAAARALRDAARRARDRRDDLAHPAAPRAAHSDLADALFDAGCVRLGRFTLKSGLTSPVYIDLRRVTADADLTRAVARAYLDLIRPLAFDHVAALPYAGLPIGSAVALEGGHSLIYPRREAKSYGTRAAVEGVFQRGERALVVDDLATTGGTKLEAVAKLRAAGLDVQDVAVLVDRESGGAKQLEADGLTLHSVFRFGALLERWRATDRITATQHDDARRFIADSGG